MSKSTPPSATTPVSAIRYTLYTCRNRISASRRLGREHVGAHHRHSASPRSTPVTDERIRVRIAAPSASAVATTIATTAARRAPPSRSPARARGRARPGSSRRRASPAAAGSSRSRGRPRARTRAARPAPAPGSRRIWRRPRAHRPQGRELVVAPSHREVQARRHPDDHEPDAGQGRGEVHAHREGLRQLREQCLDRCGGAARGPGMNPALQSPETGPAAVFAQTSSRVRPASGIANCRSSDRCDRDDDERRVRHHARELGRRRDGFDRDALAGQPDVERRVRGAMPQLSETSAGSAAGAGQSPPITFPAPGRTV